jgi:predicted RNA binding protein YcfA (HicA-like mRNA interferase family)
MDSRTVIQALLVDGWVLRDIEGSHHQFTHPSKRGKVTVQHPRKDIPIGTLKSIERQSGLRFRRGGGR